MLAATAAFAALLPVAMRQLGTMTGITGATPIAVETMAVPPATGTALGTMAGGGASTARFAAGGNSVTVSVLCSGRGTMTLRVAADRPTVLPCDTAQPAFAMLQSAGRLDRFTVVVRADPAVRWTLSVGALRPPTPTPHVVRSSA
jgi:hypothetical protein